MISRLGRKFQADPRDLKYLASDHLKPLKVAPKLTQKYWNPNGWWGNQGSTPQCVGYAWAHWISDEPITHKVNPYVAPRVIYRGAQQNDEWPGTNYNGSSVRGGAKFLKQQRKIVSYYWAYDVATVANAILTLGPVIMGTDWYYNMFETDAAGLIHADGGVAGGHAYVLDGVDTVKSTFRIKNSWGKYWGVGGTATISFGDMAILLASDGEACIAVETLHS